MDSVPLPLRRWLHSGCADVEENIVPDAIAPITTPAVVANPTGAGGGEEGPPAYVPQGASRKTSDVAKTLWRGQAALLVGPNQGTSKILFEGADCISQEEG